MPTIEPNIKTSGREDVVKILQEKFTELQLKNPRISLRSFSARIQLPTPVVSEVLRSKRNVTRKLAVKICEGLSLDPVEIKKLVEAIPAKQKKTKRVSSQKQVQLAADEFHLISDWYCFAILSLAKTQNFKSDICWIANRLGIGERNVKNGVDCLIRLGFLKQEGDLIIHAGKELTTTQDVPNSAIKRHHQQALEQAQEALIDMAVELREFGASVFACDPAKLPEAKAMIREMRRKVVEMLESTPPKEVYRLSVQLIPLTTFTNERVLE